MRRPRPAASRYPNAETEGHLSASGRSSASLGATVYRALPSAELMVLGFAAGKVVVTQLLVVLLQNGPAVMHCSMVDGSSIGCQGVVGFRAPALGHQPGPRLRQPDRDCAGLRGAHQVCGPSPLVASELSRVPKR